ncbi:MAG: hypothetical protein NVSMB4_13780 [Acidimicrobiales bacterium]
MPAEALSIAALAVARRFSAGATMWCVSQRWPEHARHVAVEFVHPVVMGARALPAVAVGGPYPVQAVRAAGRAGDVLVALGGSDDDVVLNLSRRAPAWGMETVWIGSGAPPTMPATNHVLWAEGSNAPYDGRLALLYHVLWELTHVCFEHPGLLREASDRDDAGCITCTDEGRPAEVVSVEGAEATVRTANGMERIDTSLVGPLDRNDLVLVHAGTAIEILQ